MSAPERIWAWWEHDSDFRSTHRWEDEARSFSDDEYDGAEYIRADTVAETIRQAVQADKEKLGRELNLARYGQPDFSWQVHKEALAAANARADRAEAALAAQVKVKPLVWVEFADRGAKAQAWNEANYMIQKWSDGQWELSASYPGYSTSIYGIDRFHGTIEAAKAAAQADYDTRILAALSATTEERK